MSRFKQPNNVVSIDVNKTKPLLDPETVEACQNAVKPTPDQIIHDDPELLENAEKIFNGLGYIFKYNSFKHNTWVLVQENGIDKFIDLDDKVLTRVRYSFETTVRQKSKTNRNYRITKERLVNLINLLGEAEPFHPVQAYLDRAQQNWDGTPRMESFLIDYFGVEDTPLNRAKSGLLFVTAVHRIRHPGCKVDHIFVLESPQGFAKTSVVRTLCAGMDDAFAPSINFSVDEKKFIEKIQGRWFGELAELNVKDKDWDTFKDIATRQEDECRMSYDKFVTKTPRQIVFVATYNPKDGEGVRYIPRADGSRRIIPITCNGRIDTNKIDEVMSQIYGEAATLEARGTNGKPNFITKVPFATGTQVALPEDLWSAIEIEQLLRVRE